MANNANYGFEHRFSVAASPATFSGSSSRFDLLGSTVGLRSEVLDSGMLTGSRTRREDRSRWGLQKVEGQISLEPTPKNLAFFLTYILGSVSSNTYSIADGLSGFDMLHDPYATGSNAIKLVELYVDKATWRFGPGIQKLTLDVKGKSATSGQAYAGAALGAGAGHTPYTFDDSVSGFTLKSTVLPIESGELTINNHLDVRFRNSRTATSIRAMDRQVTLATSIPNTSTNLGLFFGDTAAASATIVFTAGSLSCTVNLYNLKNPDQWPVVNGKNEVLLVLDSAARGDSSNPDIQIVNVSA